MFVICVYAPGDTKYEHFAQSLFEVKQFLGNTKKDMVVVGDFNLPPNVVEWTKDDDDEIFPTIVQGREDESTDIGQKRNKATALFDFAENYLLQQIITIPTRKENIIDLAYTNIEHNELVSITDEKVSDHNLISCKLDKDTEIKSKAPLQQIRSIKNMDKSELTSDLSRRNWDFLHENTTAAKKKAILVDVINEELHKCGAKWISTSNTNRHITNLEDKKRKKLSSLKYLKKPEDRAKCIQSAYKLGEKIARTKHEQEKKKEKQAINGMLKDPKSFYKYVNKFKQKPQVSPLLHANKIVTNDEDKANILQGQYLSVFPIPDPKDNIEDIIEFSNTNTTGNLVDMEINEEKITNVIEQMPGNAAGGSDGIRTSILKAAKDGLAKPLSIIFRQSLDNFESLEEVYETIIIPILKPGKNRQEASSYRPIALCSQIVKIMEKLVVTEIEHHLRRKDLSDETQFGFVRGRSSQDQLTRYISFVTTRLHCEQNDCIYLDYGKAFDSVSHNCLIRKLKNHFQIGGKILIWISEFLRNRTQMVKIGSHMSDKGQVLASVTQGSVLGPTLFALYIFDMHTPKMIKHISGEPKKHESRSLGEDSRVLKFADDTKCLAGSLNCTPQSGQEQLQQKLNEIYNWAKDNKMNFNSDKFAHIQFKTFATKGAEQNQQFFAELPFHQTFNPSYLAPNGQEIQTVIAEKDLGIWIRADLDWATNVSYASAKTWSKTFCILNTFSTRNANTLTFIWKAICLPTLLYNSAVMGNLSVKCESTLEQVQRKFTKHLDLEKKNPPYHERLKLTKLNSIQRSREKLALLQIGKEIRTKKLHEIGIKIEKDNARTGIRLSITAPKYGHRKSQTLLEKSFPNWGCDLFNALPYSVKQTVLNKQIFSECVSELCHSLADTPFLTPHKENSILSRLKEKNW